MTKDREKPKIIIVSLQEYDSPSAFVSKIYGRQFVKKQLVLDLRSKEDKSDLRDEFTHLAGYEIEYRSLQIVAIPIAEIKVDHERAFKKFSQLNNEPIENLNTEVRVYKEGLEEMYFVCDCSPLRGEHHVNCKGTWLKRALEKRLESLY